MFKGIFGQPGGTNDQLINITVKNRAGLCNPADGLGRVDWLVQGDLTGATIEVYANAGLGYELIETGVNPLLGTVDFNCSGVTGFSSLDTTDIRVELIFGFVQLSGSPKVATPPYACYP